MFTDDVRKTIRHTGSTAVRIIINFIEILFLLFFLVYSYAGLKYNGDNLFMLANAKVILESGFPVNDPLSMHHTFAYVTPQWLYAVILYLLKQLTGDAGVTVFGVGSVILLNFLAYRMIRIYVKNETLATDIFMIGVMPALTVYFSVLRPMVLTASVCMLLFLVLEKYAEKPCLKSTGYVFLISVLEINLHNSLWISLILVEMCFLADMIFRRIRKQDADPVRFILYFMVPTALGALINPYGLSYVGYIFRSLVAIAPFKNFINELCCPNSPILWGFVGVETALCAWAALSLKKLPPLKYALLTFGFFAMFAMCLRNFVFFSTLGQAVPLWYIGQIAPKEKSERMIRHFSVPVIACALIICAMFPHINVHKPCFSDSEYSYPMAYQMKEEGVDTEAKILTTFNDGSYFEYLGYHPYIDPRAELFGIAVNGVCDVATEYIDLIRYDLEDQEAFNDFVDRYGFDYICMIPTRHIYELVENSGRYVLWRQEGGTKFYERKTETD